MDESAIPRTPTDRHDATARPPFQPGGRERLNRQCRSLPSAPYLETDVAIPPQQRKTAVLDDRQQMLLQARRRAGVTRQELDDQLRITMDEKTMIENRSVLTCNTAEYEELLEVMRLAAQTADKLIAEVTPSLSGERYLTTEQVMTHFHISRRALQNYRDKGIIPYTSVGGTLLYPESKINEVLERNYYKPRVFGR